MSHTFFVISNTFVTNASLKLAKNQAKAKQHPEAKLRLKINFLHSRYHPKIIGDILKNVQKTSTSV